MAKKALMLYLDQLEVIDAMDDEQVGKLFRALKAYQLGDDVEPYLSDQIVRVVFIQFKSVLSTANRKYEEICERNRANGIKGGRPKTQNNPVGFSENPEKPKITQSVLEETQKTQVVFSKTQKNPKDKIREDKDIKEKKDKRKEKPDGFLFPPPKASKVKTDDFVPPSLKEVEAFFRQSAAQLPTWQDEAKIFFYHYDGLGWRNTHGVKIRNWDSFANKWIFDKINENKRRTNRQSDKRTTTSVEPDCGLIEPPSG